MKSFQEDNYYLINAYSAHSKHLMDRLGLSIAERLILTECALALARLVLHVVAGERVLMTDLAIG